VALWRQPVASLRPDLLELFERSELKKYLTEEELPAEAAVPSDASGIEAAPGTAEPKESE
jgi:succinate dehydrogenase / fumarate reductase flavoprotein subunit